MDTHNITNAKSHEEFLEILKCRICLLVSLTPVTCIQCDSVFCKECIQSWKKKSNTCPMRCQNLKVNEDNRIIKNILSKFKYKCTKCLNDIDLNNYYTHNSNCTEDLIRCQNGCGELIQEKFLNTHYKLFCQNSYIKCVNCNSKVKRCELNYEKEIPQEKFNKLKELENELKLKDEIIDSLDRKLNQLQSEIQINPFINENINNNILNNIDSSDLLFSNSYLKNLIDSENIKEIKKLNLKEELKIKNNNLIMINFIESFKFNNNEYIILAVTSGDIIIYDLQNNLILQKIKFHSDNFTDLKIIRNFISNDEYLISASFDSNLISMKISDLIVNNNNKQILKLECPASCLLVNADFNMIFIGDVNGFIRSISLEDLGIIIQNKVHKSRILCIEYTETRDLLLTYSKDRTLSIIDLNNFNSIKTVSLNCMITHSINLNNENIYFIDDKGNIYIYDNSDNINVLKIVYKSNLENVSNSKLFSLRFKNNQNILITLNHLNGIKFFSCIRDKINLITEKKIDEITSFNILKRIENKNNNIMIEEENYENYFGIISTKNGTLSILELK